MITNKNVDWSKYLGIPYEHKSTGFDGVYCWGLVRLIYRKELGIELGDYWYEEDWYRPEQSDDEKFLNNTENEGFRKIGRSEIRQFDGVLMRLKSRKVNHCGLITNGKREKKIIHCHENNMSNRVPISRLDNLIHSFWRYEQ